MCKSWSEFTAKPPYYRLAELAGKGNKRDRARSSPRALLYVIDSMKRLNECFLEHLVHYDFARGQCLQRNNSRRWLTLYQPRDLRHESRMENIDI